MHFLMGIWNGLGEIWSHKLRSLLTITCVMLGVASLVVITGFITGLFHFWEVWSQEYGGILKVSVSAVAPPEKQKHLAGLSEGRTLRDALIIEALARYARCVSPEIQAGGTLRFGANHDDLSIAGATPGVLPIRKYEVVRGRFLTDLDIQRCAAVVVLGSSSVKNLFQRHEDPLGQVVAINGLPFTVVGLLKHYEMKTGEYNMLERKNQIAFIPLTAMQRRLGHTALTELNVEAHDIKDLAHLTDEINNILERTHRGVQDFKIFTGEEGMENFNSMRRSFFVVGGGVGLITLLVGGIGIMNLMLASINERVREIGIRKAVGAWTRDIFVQFLAEAVALSALGGVVGILLGVAVIRIMRHVMGGGGSELSPPILSPEAVLLGFAFSVTVGIVAGLYPAFKAARLDPIEALRYE